MSAADGSVLQRHAKVLEHGTDATEHRWTVDIEGVDLWSPHARGDQPLSTVAVEEVAPARTDSTDLADMADMADRTVARRTVGFRTVTIGRSGVMSVNDAPIFLKGSVWAASAGTPDSDEAIEDAVSMARTAGLDLLWVRHPAPDALYDAADRAGLLLVQDVGHRAPTGTIERLAHHPSIAAWCPTGRFPRRRATAASLREADPSRPVVDWAARRPSRLGWIDGDERALPDLLRRRPRRAVFVSGFGAPSAGPTARELTESEDLARHHQAMVVRFHVESLRRLKYAPSVGFAHDLFVDTGEGDSSALLDAAGTPKEAFEALRRACRPVLAVADRLPPHLHGNEALALDLHLVNDRPVAVRGARLVAVLTWQGGSQRYEFAGDVAADSVRRVGTLQFVVPEVSGPLELALALHMAGESDRPITSAYRSDIFAHPHDH